ncbi:LPS-assembly protein LptD [Campylobacter volucris]|uniref:LPS-assembly protein LptD n=1 Tax=Campylobacter volucris TaxID=1031542 RepID=A0A5C7DYP7_9BACT|nr:LPS-assembly protein LptD [Campylobacter volucris]TXE86240.1 LPS-assembly protein LptD [Campylobacter volucris]
MRKIFLSFACIVNLYAAKVDIYALDVAKNRDIIEAKSNVVVVSDLYLITANEAKFNEKTKDLELFGDVNILRGQKERTHSSYTKINLQDNTTTFKNLFFSNNDLEVWLQCYEAKFDKKFFITEKSVVSSCNVENPDWEIRFEEGKLNKESNFLHLYNARLYVKNTPVAYLPYFGFSVDTKRKSGLLIPQIVAKQSEGLYYNQPIYYVIDDNADLQLEPQIRTKRGYGLYSTLRFVDSLNSQGEISTGIFVEKSDYREKEKLKNKEHYGFEIKYSSDELFKSLLNGSYQEGLWLDGKYLNDVDYMNLSSKAKPEASLVTSRLNYFLSDDENYYGLYAKYYIDTSKISNKDTLQEYPSLQYHRYLNGIFDNYIQYSIDASFHRYYRHTGIYAKTLNFDVPLVYHTSFFDDFLNFSFTERVYANFVNYSNTNEKNQEHLFRNSHNFSLYTDLSKPYENFYHTVYLGINYYLSGAKSGKITENFIDIEDEPEQINFSMYQYFYNAIGKKKLFHNFAIKYNLTEQNFGGFDNIVEYFYNDYISFRNETEYNGVQNRFDKIFSEASLDYDKWKIGLSHAYRFYENEKYNFLGTKTQYNINTNYQIFGGIWFDLDKNPDKWEIGYTYQRKCWNYSLMYRQDISPKLTSAGISAKDQSGVYFMFNFYPIGGVSYDFALEESEKAL